MLSLLCKVRNKPFLFTVHTPPVSIVKLSNERIIMHISLLMCLYEICILTRKITRIWSIYRHSLQSNEVHLCGGHLSACDLVLMPFYRFLNIQYDRLSQNVPQQLWLSAILMYNKAWFIWGHKRTFPCIPYTVSQILLKFDTEDFH
jgi:hypothetical protein